MLWVTKAYNSPCVKAAQTAAFGKSVYDYFPEEKFVIPSQRVARFIYEVATRVLFKRMR